MLRPWARSLGVSIENFLDMIEVSELSVDQHDPIVTNYPRRSDPPPQDRASQLAAVYIRFEQSHRSHLLLTVAIYLLTGIAVYVQLTGSNYGLVFLPFLAIFGIINNSEACTSLKGLLGWSRRQQVRFQNRLFLADLCFQRRRFLRPILQMLQKEIELLCDEDVEALLERERLRQRKLPGNNLSL